MDIFFWAVWIFGLVFVISFGAVLLIGAPYMPTLRDSANKALDMLDLKPGQTLIELGSGDGVVLKLAAQRGLNVVGYELNPFLVIISRLRTFRYRRQVKVVWRDFWKADLTGADGVFVFLLDKFMDNLDRKIGTEAQGKKIKLVSHAFKIAGKKPARKSGALFLYVYG